MSDPPGIRDRAEQEAAAWFARLRTSSVSLSTLEEFRVWRQSPGNRSAYSAVEAQWKAMGKLEGEPEVDIAIAAALARGAEASGGHRRFSAPWIAGAAMAGALAIAVVAYGVLSRGVLSTTVGEQRLVRLADGSRLRLDTDSKVIVRLSGGERHIELVRGQAFFDVAHDARRPFVVEAGATSVRAIGTRFDVRRDGDEVRATLVEGVVQVRAGGGPAPTMWTLRPGQQITTDHAAPRTREVDVQAATGWTSGHVVFEGLPLSQAIAEVNRYSRRKVTLEDPAIGQVPVTGVFDSGDTDAFVSAVCALHALSAHPGPGGGVRLVRAAASAPAG